jgi:hypothetical protein
MSGVSLSGLIILSTTSRMPSRHRMVSHHRRCWQHHVVVEHCWMVRVLSRYELLHNLMPLLLGSKRTWHVRVCLGEWLIEWGPSKRRRRHHNTGSGRMTGCLSSIDSCCRTGASVRNARIGHVVVTVHPVAGGCQGTIVGAGAAWHFEFNRLLT